MDVSKPKPPESSTDPLISEWEVPASEPGEARRSPALGGMTGAWSSGGLGVSSVPFREFTLGDPYERVDSGLGGGATPSRANAITQTARGAGVGKVTGRGEEFDPRFPPLGGLIAGFRLVAVLGRGAFAQVYLAEQIELAGRLVALKVSRALGEEPQWLARLQHANIVPIHSVHDDAASGLRLLCMPYLGGANLAQLLEAAEGFKEARVTGRSLVKALDRLEERTHATVDAQMSRVGSMASRREAVWTSAGLVGRAQAASRGYRSPARARSALARYLSRLSWSKPPGANAERAVAKVTGDTAALEHPARAFYRKHSLIHAAAFITEKLARALEHAHERGILHRDLKPSNVLIAVDGTPMLLDFNLSQEIQPSEAGAEVGRVGGTLPYMSPEHLEAFHPESRAPLNAVDERSDLYALGLILFEMLAGRHPFADPDPSLPIGLALDRMIAERKRGAPALRRLNPEVPPSLASIVRMCLHPDPEQRYASASELAEDLKCFLEHRPLRYALDIHPKERLEKWLRRHPGVRSATGVGVLSAVLLCAVGGVAWGVSNRLQQAEAENRFARLQGVFQECQLLLNTAQGPRWHVSKGVARANGVLGEYGITGDRLPDGWSERSAVARLDERSRRRLREQLSELLLLRARVLREHAQSRDHPGARGALLHALDDLRIAEQIEGRPTAAVLLERLTVADLLSDAALEQRTRERLAGTDIETARDHYLVGTVLAASGALDRAAMHLARAIALDPNHFWAWFAQGLCHFEQGRFLDAASDFGVCTVQAPRFAWPYLNRGLALAASGRLEEARASYDQAIALDDRFGEARVNRALVLLELGETEAALKDLRAAIGLGMTGPEVLAAEAEALGRTGRREQAEAAFARALRVVPDDTRMLVARGFFRIGHDAQGAAADLERARRLDPSNARALLGLAHLKRWSDPRRALELIDLALGLDSNLLDAVALRAMIRAHHGDPAAEGDADQLLMRPTRHNLYNAACAVSRLAMHTGNPQTKQKARMLLERALGVGIDASDAKRDPDLSWLFETDQTL